jgi:ABC-type lipoprotein release transport system permease subunit
MVTRLAFRNLKRHFRRTLISTVGIALGVALSLFSLGLGDGGHNQMIENGVRIGQGHLTVQVKSYLEAPSPSKYIQTPGPIVSALNEMEDIKLVLPRIRGEGILATAAGSEGIQFLGIDPRLPGEGGMFRDSMQEGNFLAEPDSAKIVIGAKLAKRLKLAVGKKTVLTCQDAEGEITSILLRVAGIFRSGSSAIDGIICLVPINTLQGTMGIGNGVTSLAIYLEDPFQQNRVYTEVAGLLPEGPLSAYHWEELQPDLRDYVVIDNIFGYLTYGVIIFLLSIGVLNTVLMSVMERRREIGILTALGMGSGAVLRMVLLETALITIIGIGGGLVLGLAVNWYFSVHGINLTAFSSEGWDLAGTVIDPVMYSQLRPHRVIQLCVIVFLLTVTMGMYPAIKASRTQPVEAMEKP